MCVPLFYQKSIYLSIYLSRATMGHLGLGDGWAPQLGLPQPGLGNPAAVASPAVPRAGRPEPSGDQRTRRRAAGYAGADTTGHAAHVGGLGCHKVNRLAACAVGNTQGQRLGRRLSEAPRRHMAQPGQSPEGCSVRKLEREGGCRLCQPALPLRGRGPFELAAPPWST